MQLLQCFPGFVDCLMAFSDGFILHCATPVREFSLNVRQRIMPEPFQYDVFLSHNAKDKPRGCGGWRSG